MSLIQEYHDSLPYIDSDVSQHTRSQIDRAIAQELPPEYKTILHPSIPDVLDSNFSDLMNKELERKASGLPMTGGIDLSRYEAPEPPENTDENKNKVLEGWKESLRQAYTSSYHLSMRVENLFLLEQYGKNAWLIGNSQLEELLRDLEKELVEVKEATELVNKTRKSDQGKSKGEMVGLDETWKRGVGRIIEVELAAEDLRRQILERRRETSR